MIIRKKSTSAAVVAIALGMMTAPVAVSAQGAQGYQQQTPPAAGQGQETAAPDFSGNDLESYATAFLEVRDISQKYQGEMQSAESPEDQQAIQQKAVEEMSEAVRETGLSVEKYNQITEASRTDPELQQEVMDKIAEVQN